MLGLTVCPETPVTNNQPTLCNSQKNEGLDYNQSVSLKLHMGILCLLEQHMFMDILVLSANSNSCMNSHIAA
jgi:hypothetical protein